MKEFLRFVDHLFTLLLPVAFLLKLQLLAADHGSSGVLLFVTVLEIALILLIRGVMGYGPHEARRTLRFLAVPMAVLALLLLTPLIGQQALGATLGLVASCVVAFDRRDDDDGHHGACA